jgi:hypothetical protein
LKKILLTAMLVLFLSPSLFLSGTFSSSVAHAASSPTITKEKTVVHLSSHDCSILLKSNSKLTKKDCTATLTSTTISHLSTMTANSCPYGYVSHSVTDSGFAWDAELDSEFYFPGNCTRPSVTYLNCLNNMDAAWPESIANTSCTSINLDSSRVMAQGIWTVTAILGAGSFNVTIQSIANSNGAISDTRN